jgi:hypothetical protein
MPNLIKIDTIFQPVTLFKMLHTYNDGSKLITMSAKDLINIPVWKGNRILDVDHMKNIKKDVGQDVRLLDSNYSVVTYDEVTASGETVPQTYLIDGQHRAHIIRDYYKEMLCEPDFTVTVRQKVVESEGDAVEYFNALNNVKRQFWNSDPNLIANMYILALEKIFNTDKKCPMIRPNAHRPYLSSDKLREVLLKHSGFFKNSTAEIAKFIAAAKRRNTQIIKELEISSALPNKNITLIERSMAVGFGLAWDTKLGWIGDILNR